MRLDGFSMTEDELTNIIESGEDSTHQFKRACKAVCVNGLGFSCQ